MKTLKQNLVSGLFITCMSVMPAHAIEYSYTPSPIIGYNPTDGAILGGALFRHAKDPEIKADFFGVQMMANRYKDGMAIVNYYQPPEDQSFGFAIESSYNSFRYKDYGTGNSTSADIFDTIEGDGYQIKPELLIAGTEHTIWSIHIDTRGRSESQVNDDPNLVFSSETSAYAVGLQQTIDHRNDSLNSTSGSYFQWSVGYLPEAQSTTAYLNIDFRLFSSLSKSWTSASRLSLGVFNENPGYLFKYTLGGESGLRGFHGDRFQGDRFYLLQQEFRFPIWKTIDGAVFAEIGDVSYDKLDNTRSSTGFGLRFGLPPDFRMKLRFDFGIDDEGEMSMFVNFGQFF